MRCVTLSPQSARNLRALRRIAHFARIPRIITEPDPERKEHRTRTRVQLARGSLKSSDESFRNVRSRRRSAELQGERDGSPRRSRSFKSRDHENSRNFGSRLKRSRCRRANSRSVRVPFHGSRAFPRVDCRSEFAFLTRCLRSQIDRDSRSRREGRANPNARWLRRIAKFKGTRGVSLAKEYPRNDAIHVSPSFAEYFLFHFPYRHPCRPGFNLESMDYIMNSI